MEKNNKSYLGGLIIGSILIIIGLFIQVPGGALTTYSSLNGEVTDYFEFDDKYSAIDEYVGGDAYNYIIGSSLVAGKMAGMIAAKAIFIVGGAICLCIGFTLMIQQKGVLNVKSSLEDLKNSKKNDENVNVETVTMGLEESVNMDQTKLVVNDSELNS